MSGLRWRPLAPVALLKKRRPNACFGGGEALVVAWLGGRWVALRDRCPHRGAPLSQGKLVGGFAGFGARGLQCPYHGWEVAPDGLVVAAQGLAVPHGACTQDFPVLEAGGLLWAAVAAGGKSPGEAADAAGAQGTGSLDVDLSRPAQPPGVGLPKDARPWTRWQLLFPADVVAALVLGKGRLRQVAPDLFVGPDEGEALVLVPIGPGATEAIALGPAGLKAGAWPEPAWWAEQIGPAELDALPEGLGAGWRLD